MLRFRIKPWISFLQKIIHRLGGLTIAQDPATAERPSMPEAAIATGAVDRIVPLEGIGPLLAKLGAPANGGSSRREGAV